MNKLLLLSLLIVLFSCGNDSDTSTLQAKDPKDSVETINEKDSITSDTTVTDSIPDTIDDSTHTDTLNLTVADTIAPSISFDEADTLYVMHGDSCPIINVILYDDVTSAEMLAENIVSTNGKYSFVDVYIDGIKIANDSSLYTMSNTTTLNFVDVGKLPGGNIQAGANIYIVESATVDLQDSVQTDLPGKSVAIKVSTNDAIAIKLGQKRIFPLLRNTLLFVLLFR